MVVGACRIISFGSSRGCTSVLVVAASSGPLLFGSPSPVPLRWVASRTEVPASTSRRANAICSGVSFGGRPKRTPRVLAATRPELVRWWMRARSNSAMPAKTVSTILPAGEVVSAHGSPRLRRPVPPSFRISAISSRSRVERADRC